MKFDVFHRRELKEKNVSISHVSDRQTVQTFATKVPTSEARVISGYVVLIVGVVLGGVIITSVVFVFYKSKGSMYFRDS